MSICLMCGREGYPGDLAWHVRQDHLIPFLERPEDAPESARALVNTVRLLSAYLIVDHPQNRTSARGSE